MSDPTPAIEVWARLLCAADVHVHGGDHPTWQQLSTTAGRSVQDDYRKAAAWLLPRVTVVAPVDDAPKCGAWGGCPLPLGHNRGRSDIPENHHGLSEDLFTGPQWETRDPEAEERERDIQREA